jgi:SAM-dependent methyltransferase
VPIDTKKPSIARVYDYALGGKDHFEADRQVFNHMLATVDPHIGTLARIHRDWSRKVVRWLASEVGIDQFLDCGSGLPTMENTHEVAQAINPEARVVYVDNDPTVVAHGRALLEENDRTLFLAADLTEPDKLFAHDRLRTFLDPDRPIAMIQCSTFHHIEHLHDQQRIMASYLRHLPTGSYVALTHLHNPQDGSRLAAMADGMQSSYRSVNSELRMRPYAEIVTLFDDLDMVEPGLVPLHRWWPSGPTVADDLLIYDICLGAVGRKA